MLRDVTTGIFTTSCHCRSFLVLWLIRLRAKAALDDSRWQQRSQRGNNVEIVLPLLHVAIPANSVPKEPHSAFLVTTSWFGQAHQAGRRLVGIVEPCRLEL